MCIQKTGCLPSPIIPPSPSLNLCYTEAGFAERYIGDVQMLLTKPLCRRAPVLPLLA